MATNLNRIINNSNREFQLIDHATGEEYNIEPTGTTDLHSIEIPNCNSEDEYEMNHFSLKSEEADQYYYLWQEGDDVKISGDDAYDPSAEAVPGLAGKAGQHVRFIIRDNQILGEVDDNYN